jgi:choice-of-anchor C domain-containing protein
MLAAVAVVAFLATSGKSNASLITNGSFEGSGTINTYQTLGTGSTLIDGWKVTAGSIDWIGNYWKASDGDRSIDLSGNVPGTIVGQSFDTAIGQQYKVRFDMAGNPDRPSIKTLEVKVAEVVQEFTFDSNGKTKIDMGWVQKSLTFVAVSETTSLQFRDLGITAWGVALDNVSVDAVPEPTTLAIWGTLGGLGLIAARRRRKLA